MSIPPITVDSNVDLDVQDSCNCCVPFSKPKLKRADAKADLYPEPSPRVVVRDVNEVFNLTINMPSPEPADPKLKLKGKK